MRPIPGIWFLSLVVGMAAHAANTLDIYFIDVEGGQSTLVVSPSGQSLLIDTGFAGFNGRDPDRIAAAAKAAGVWGAASRVAIMNNGPRKGGTAEGWKGVMGSPGLEDLWQASPDGSFTVTNSRNNYSKTYLLNPEH